MICIQNNLIKVDAGEQIDHDERIIKVLQYVTENFEDQIYLDDLAKVSGYSKFHFNRYFYSKLNTTPMKWLWLYRLMQAFLKIRSNPDQSLQSIALSCGFSSAISLSKSYKRTFGLSPSQTRRCHIQSLEPEVKILKWLINK